MILKIEKDCVGRETVIRLSGRLKSAHVDELKTQLGGGLYRARRSWAEGN